MLDYKNKESIWELQFALDNNFHTAGRFNRAEGLNHEYWNANGCGQQY